ncbi:MAG: nitroreductase family protein [Myxococcales bacterium]|nr:nitroreductase family protein [Myxococcales bacterium]
MASDGHISLRYQRPAESDMRVQAAKLLSEHQSRRSVRHFSCDPIPLDVLHDCIRAAGLAPSGANKQPWTFCVVTDPALKTQIRDAAEAEERAFYRGRAPQSWLDDLAHLGTDHNKPFLEEAPALVVLFAQNRGANGSKHYYISESVGIAAGFFISALHRCGLVTLTHTPSPMKFLGELLGRPASERAFLLLPVGYPASDCEVPDIERKPFAQICVGYHAGAK